ncbi:MAG: IclR family transcriptional regulator [Clostridia bacterium]|nr:IclR family transcriptional regulator [Clostridia bacterium]
MERFKPDQYPSLKALWILEAVARRGTYMGINEICEETGISQGTVHRILNEMVQAGYIEKNNQYRKYRVGMNASIMASYFMQSNSVVAFARDEMLRLNQMTGETIHLLALSGNDVIYLNKINTVHTIGLMSYIGKTNPIHCTAGGKCIMAFMQEDKVNKYLAESQRERYTETTLCTEEALRKEFESIRRLGYALDRGEHHANVTCIAAPVFDIKGLPVASISISAPTYRFPLEAAESSAPELMKSCKIVTERLNSTPS